MSSKTFFESHQIFYLYRNLIDRVGQSLILKIYAKRYGTVVILDKIQ